MKKSGEPGRHQVPVQAARVLDQRRAVGEIEGYRRLRLERRGDQAMDRDRGLAAAGAAGEEERSRSAEDLVLLAGELELQLVATLIREPLQVLLPDQGRGIDQEPAEPSGDLFFGLYVQIVGREEEAEEGLGIVGRIVGRDLGETSCRTRRRLVDAEILQRLQLEELGFG